MTENERKCLEVSRMLLSAEHGVFFGGAGVSTDSGLADFRSAKGGLYNQPSGYGVSPEEILTPAFYEAHPAEFFDYYRTKLLNLAAPPNSVHRILAELEARGLIKCVITQNADNLHQRAGSRNVIDIHGNVYINTCPAHKTYPTVKIDIDKANKRPLGSVETCNKRVINQYIHPAVMQSCQLCMGMTQLAPGSNWNSMPCHTHERRMEVYFYFDLKDNNVVFHMMGEPTETRHLLMHNEQAVISPSWSIHTGVGTSNYTFIWGMCGENQEFDDMDNIDPMDLR